jgi:hypothetical protein
LEIEIKRGYKRERIALRTQHEGHLPSRAAHLAVAIKDGASLMLFVRLSKRRFTWSILSLRHPAQRFLQMSFSIAQDGGRYSEGGQALDLVLPRQWIVGFSIATPVVIVIRASDVAIGGADSAPDRGLRRAEVCSLDICDERSSNQIFQLLPTTMDPMVRTCFAPPPFDWASERPSATRRGAEKSMLTRRILPR